MVRLMVKLMVKKMTRTCWNHPSVKCGAPQILRNCWAIAKLKPQRSNTHVSLIGHWMEWTSDIMMYQLRSVMCRSSQDCLTCFFQTSLKLVALLSSSAMSWIGCCEPILSLSVHTRQKTTSLRLRLTSRGSILFLSLYSVLPLVDATPTSYT